MEAVAPERNHNTTVVAMLKTAAPLKLLISSAIISAKNTYVIPKINTGKIVPGRKPARFMPVKAYTKTAFILAVIVPAKSAITTLAISEAHILLGDNLYGSSAFVRFACIAYAHIPNSKRNYRVPSFFGIIFIFRK